MHTVAVWAYCASIDQCTVMEFDFSLQSFSVSVPVSGPQSKPFLL